MEDLCLEAAEDVSEEAMDDVPDDAIDLRIYFTGLIAFAEEQRNGERLRAHALVVDARTPGSDSEEKTAGVIPHIPVVQYALRDLDGDPKALGHNLVGVGSTHRHRVHDQYPGERGLWVLDKEILRLDSTLTTVESGLTIDRRALAGAPTPDEGDKDSIQWIARLQGKNGRPGELREGLLNPLGSESAREKLAASFLLDRGRLLPAALAAELGYFVVFRTGTIRQALASVVQLSVRVRGDSVRLVSTKFDGSEGSVLTLRPKEERRVEIWILNREWDAIQNQTPARPIRPGEVNPEYYFLYDLLDNRPDDDAALPAPSCHYCCCAPHIALKRFVHRGRL